MPNKEQDTKINRRKYLYVWGATVYTTQETSAIQTKMSTIQYLPLVYKLE